MVSNNLEIFVDWYRRKFDHNELKTQWENKIRNNGYNNHCKEFCIEDKAVIKDKNGAL